jgi:hypothetical protein
MAKAALGHVAQARRPRSRPVPARIWEPGKSDVEHLAADRPLDDVADWQLRGRPTGRSRLTWCPTSRPRRRFTVGRTACPGVRWRGPARATRCRAGTSGSRSASPSAVASSVKRSSAAARIVRSPVNRGASCAGANATSIAPRRRDRNTEDVLSPSCSASDPAGKPRRCSVPRVPRNRRARWRLQAKLDLDFDIVFRPESARCSGISRGRCSPRKMGFDRRDRAAAHRRVRAGWLHAGRSPAHRSG